MRLTVSQSESKSRLDMFVMKALSITRSQAQRMIESGDVLVCGDVSKSGLMLKLNDSVEINNIKTTDFSIEPDDKSINLLYSDEHIAVVDKPAGMVVHPAPGHAGGTLLNALLFKTGRLASVGGPMRPGVVHRLDKDTSGVIVVALSDEAYYGLVEQFMGRTISRLYLALVYGSLKTDEGEISRGIGRSASNRKKMSTKTRRPKEAKTLWQVVKRYPGATLIEARLQTGRTHQIRVHFASIGHPVLGDKTYGGKSAIVIKGKTVVFPRQMLHAKTLGFVHPITTERMEFSSDVPEDMAMAMDALEGLNLQKRHA